MTTINKTIEFLYEASNCLPANGMFTAIRSRMILKCMEFTSTSSININTFPRCHSCGVAFEKVLPEHRIEPATKSNRFLRKHSLLDPCYLSKYQAISIKKYRKYKQDKQKLVTICKLCRKKSKTIIAKKPYIITSKPKRQPEPKPLQSKKELLAIKRSRKKKNLRAKQRREERKTRLIKKSAVLQNNIVPTINTNTSSEVIIDLNSPDSNKNKITNNLQSTSDFISLVTPKAKKSATIINLDDILSPIYMQNAKTDDNIITISDTPDRKKKSKISLLTPIKKKKKKSILTNNEIINIVDTPDINLNKSNVFKTKQNQNQENPKNKGEIDSDLFLIKDVETKKNKTPKKKPNLHIKKKNVILAIDDNPVEKKQKKINSLSNFLKGATNMQQSNKTTNLQDFLNTITM